MINYVIYECKEKSYKFDLKSDMIIRRIDGISSLTTTLSASQTIGQVGSTTNSVSVAPRTVSISGRIFRNLENNRKFLLDLVSDVDVGKLIVSMDNIEYYLDVRTVTTPNPLDTLQVQDFSFSLRADYPYWKTVEEELVSFSNLKKMFRFPRNFSGTWKISEITEELFKNILNTGNSAIGMTIIFLAKTDVLNPELYHFNTGKIIKFNYLLKAGEQLIVTTGDQKSVKLINNGIESNGFRYMTPESDLNMVILAGDNQFRYYADNNISGLVVETIKSRGANRGI